MGMSVDGDEAKDSIRLFSRFNEPQNTIAKLH